MPSPKVAALFVETNGIYYKIPGVECWDIRRDARRYVGPYPVVAHPPCARWGRYWSGGPSAKVRMTLGDDGGCFDAALRAVRRFGGVLEHPEASHAWRVNNLNKPPKRGGWIVSGDGLGWTCCVEQGHYGHRARKATWLYVVRVDLPSLRWGPAKGKLRLEDGYHSSEERKMCSKGLVKRISKGERLGTPLEFRDLLLSMAISVYSYSQREIPSLDSLCVV